MRKFLCTLESFEVDLDDPKTYEHLPQTMNEVRDLIFHWIGYAHCYMNYWYSDVFGVSDGGQKERVELLIKQFTDGDRNNRNNLLWHQEQLFLFIEETENMC